MILVWPFLKIWFLWTSFSSFTTRQVIFPEVQDFFFLSILFFFFKDITFSFFFFSVKWEEKIASERKESQPRYGFSVYSHSTLNRFFKVRYSNGVKRKWGYTRVKNSRKNIGRNFSRLVDVEDWPQGVVPVAQQWSVGFFAYQITRERLLFLSLSNFKRNCLSFFSFCSTSFFFSLFELLSSWLVKM